MMMENERWNLHRPRGNDIFRDRAEPGHLSQYKVRPTSPKMRIFCEKLVLIVGGVMLWGGGVLQGEGNAIGNSK